jgi:alpha-glucosidase (family GH31 glycosyl hydrolase)
MFGISMVGSDICGFSGDTTEELCVRWMQLGSFYPFMRNHNNAGAKEQDPAVFSYEAQEAMKRALNTRYALLPYLYTLLYKSHVYGEMVVRPLLFEYPQDQATHTIDRQFMFGPAFLISPVLDKGATSVNAYFPNDTWYEFNTGLMIAETNKFVNLSAPLEQINVHIRSGHIVPYQFPAVTTTLSRRNPFGLLVALDREADANGNYAYGDLFWDDGESIESIEAKNYNMFNFTATQGNIHIKRLSAGYNTTMVLSEVKVYGVFMPPKKVTINQMSYANFIYDDIYSVFY